VDRLAPWKIRLVPLSLAILILSAAALLPASAAAPWASPEERPRIDAETRAAIVDSITAVIDSVYVLGEPARLIVEGLRSNLAEGLYDGYEDPVSFAERLYEDAQAIHHDGHFSLRATPPLDPAAAAKRDEDPADLKRRQMMERARNYGFVKAEILPGGVGYLRFDEFSRGDEAFAAATAAMNFVANSNAVILDLRRNEGGSPSMIRFIAGYLFAEETHLINWDIRAENLTQQSYSADYVPGKRLIEQPVYVLTSYETYSAAEEFTFDLRNLERATVVGETTGGGGHTAMTRFFTFEDFRIRLRVPYGRAYNPLNNEGWEGTGITPHVEVPQEQALDAAHALALERLLDEEQDEILRAVLQYAQDGLNSRMHPPQVSPEELEDYVGHFGPRQFYIEGDELLYLRGGRPPATLIPMGGDLFAVEGVDFFRLRFERDSDAAVVRVHGIADDGYSDFNDRSGS